MYGISGRTAFSVHNSNCVSTVLTYFTGRAIRVVIPCEGAACRLRTRIQGQGGTRIDTGINIITQVYHRFFINRSNNRDAVALTVRREFPVVEIIEVTRIKVIAYNIDHIGCIRIRCTAGITV
ncbi:hypothetical protein D3C72_889180 [compost metagenome]